MRCNRVQCGPRLSRADIEDRKGFAERNHNNPPDWTLSIGAHRRVGKAAPGAWAPGGLGPGGSNACGCRCCPLFRDLRSKRSRDHALLAIHTGVDESRTAVLAVDGASCCQQAIRSTHVAGRAYAL